MSIRKARTTETLLMTRTTIADASEELTTRADLVAMLEAPKTSPPSPPLEGETPLESFLSKRRQWLAAGAAALTHLQPAFLVSKRRCCSKEAIEVLHRRLLNMAHINSGGGQPTASVGLPLQRSWWQSAFEERGPLHLPRRCQ
jgi:hypothetical protein